MKHPVAASLTYLAVIFAIVIVTYFLSGHKDLRAIFTRCEESVLGASATTRTCPYPSKLMKLNEDWICSCRSEAETRKSITGK